jgi:hypothetical protein
MAQHQLLHTLDAVWSDHHDSESVRPYVENHQHLLLGSTTHEPQDRRSDHARDADAAWFSI